MILAADIGGTKVNLGVFDSGDGHLKLVREGTHPSRAYARLQDLVKDFLAGGGQERIECACFGIAGPVRNGVVELTNLPWKIEAGELSDELKLRTVTLINDLEANAYGVAQLKPSDLHPLNTGDLNAWGNAALVSAGTGLGEAGLYWDGQMHHPFASEGGHADFAPLTKLDAELFGYLSDRFEHVSWEKVLSGKGLCNIHEFLRDTRRGEDPAWVAEEMQKSDPAVVITQAGLNGTSSRCALALDLFVGYYGSEAGNLALKMMATRGVYIGGGIAPKILSSIEKGRFMAAFLRKGRMRALLEAIPVRVILNPKTALLGAAHFGAFGPGIRLQ